MFDVINKDERSFLVFGPDNIYLKVTISTAIEILNKHHKGNLNSYFLFQNDVKKEAKELKSSSDQSNFINNIPIIWKEKTPKPIKNKYKLLSEEVEKLNKPSELTIRSYNPEKPVRKRRLKENEPQVHRKKLKNKNNIPLDEVKDDKKTESPRKPPVAISSHAHPDSNPAPIFLDESHSVIPTSAYILDGSYFVNSSLHESQPFIEPEVPDESYSVTLPSFLETSNNFMENTDPTPVLLSDTSYSEISSPSHFNNNLSVLYLPSIEYDNLQEYLTLENYASIEYEQDFPS